MGGTPPVTQPYRHFIQDIRLVQVAARDVAWHRRKGALPSVSIMVIPRVQPPTWSREDNGFLVEFVGELLGHPLGAKTSSTRTAWFRLKATMMVTYAVDEATTVWSKDPEFARFVDVYARSSGFLHMWPYFRELCSSATARMGLAPVFLDTVVIPPANP